MLILPIPSLALIIILIRIGKYVVVPVGQSNHIAIENFYWQDTSHRKAFRNNQENTCRSAKAAQARRTAEPFFSMATNLPTSAPLQQ